jgi:hypothetical protein
MLRTSFNIPVDAILGAFQMYSIYFIYSTNKEKQKCHSICSYIPYSEHSLPSSVYFSSNWRGRWPVYSTVIVCEQHIDLLIVLFVTSAVSNHMWRKDSVLCHSNCRGAACLVHCSGNGELRCPESKERCVPAVVITSYCVTAPHNMSYCGQTEAWHASLSEHADCIMQSSSMVRLVPAILCPAASVIASVILLNIKMQSVSIRAIWHPCVRASLV